MKEERDLKREQGKIEAEMGKRNRTKKEKKQAKVRVNFFWIIYLIIIIRMLLKNGMILQMRRNCIKNTNKVKYQKKNMIKFSLKIYNY